MPQISNQLLKKLIGMLNLNNTIIKYYLSFLKFNTDLYIITNSPFIISCLMSSNVFIHSLDGNNYNKPDKSYKNLILKFNKFLSKVLIKQLMSS
jgi:hypothetical protein